MPTYQVKLTHTQLVAPMGSEEGAMLRYTQKVKVIVPEGYDLTEENLEKMNEKGLVKRIEEETGIHLLPIIEKMGIEVEEVA